MDNKIDLGLLEYTGQEYDVSLLLDMIEEEIQEQTIKSEIKGVDDTVTTRRVNIPDGH